MIAITLLGTGSPIPDPNRAGPATLIQAGEENYLVDAGRGVLMRLAAAGCGANMLNGVLITHLHSDHITDLNDVITSAWVTTFTEQKPLQIVGPPGTKEVVDRLLHFLSFDIKYRRDHHEDLNEPPAVNVTEIESGVVELKGDIKISTEPTDHRPVDPTIAFRFDHGNDAVVVAGDTIPCVGLDKLCTGAKGLVHTVIRKDIIENIPIQRLQDVCDYHSSVEEASQTAERAGIETLVLTHYVPAFPSGQGEEWKEIASQHFSGRIELGDDLHRVEIGA
ncbi:MAG: ribonuclease Z [Acidimicrobiaceae bacterium]|nr:ribonuclease Z [Acidimicrobiaceae bacterium]